jgi:hypothetical protein
MVRIPTHTAPRVLLGVAALLFALCPALSAQEQVFTVRMTGQADGVGIAARNNAVASAEEQVVTDVLRSLINMEDLAPFKAMLRRASGYIQRYDLLHCDIANNSTTVEIDAYVLEKPLRQDVAAAMLPRLPKNSSVLLVIGEQATPEMPMTAGAGAAYLVLRDGLEKYGFTVVGPDKLNAVYSADKLLAVAGGAVDEGSRFARENLQDVVITGVATSTHEALATAGDMTRNRARVALRVFSGPDGKMTDALGAEAVVQSGDPRDGGDQAISDATGKLVTDTTVAVVLALLGRQEKDRVLLTLEQPGDGTAVREIVEALRRAEGVSGVEEMLATPALARLQIDYQGSMARLADLIAALPLSGGALEVRKAVGREITAALRH